MSTSTRTMLSILLLSLLAVSSSAFSPVARTTQTFASQRTTNPIPVFQDKRTVLRESTIPDLDVVALVVGQENYGLAIVALGEALWSFSKAPSLGNAKVLIPAGLAAVVLVAVSGPMVTSGDASSVATGLGIATAVSVGLGVSYVARLLAPFSPSPKEIAFLGLLVSIAGFFSFSQNLVVDGFVTLPSLPSVDLPSLPSIELPF
mmetsp:Transcript_19016/g.26841  ORF Transcript_19016/g.26841 Transcript_19016/m.26841 type:complete len:204 (-) Transcript_19016:100-711(-)